MALIEFTDKGLYCKAGGFYIDPWKPVERAVITHAHSDHARWGSKQYLCHRDTEPLLNLRLGPGNYQSVEWGETLFMQGVKLSLHPAGHMIGSSQIRVEYQGEVWVVSGDYKTENDGISGAFEPVRCHTFITESTFGLPIYNWEPQQLIYNRIHNWIAENRKTGKTSVLLAYSLGKAQRLLRCLAETDLELFAHGAIYNADQVLKQHGWAFPDLTRVHPELPKDRYQGGVVIAPPSADGSAWIRKFHPYTVGICSGWMQVRGNRRRRNAGAGFVLSDHADWNGLLQAIWETGAERVYVTHGFQAAFSRYLNEQGIFSAEVKTEYGQEEEEALLSEDQVHEANLNEEPNV